MSNTRIQVAIALTLIECGSMLYMHRRNKARGRRHVADVLSRAGYTIAPQKYSVWERNRITILDGPDLSDAAIVQFRRAAGTEVRIDVVAATKAFREDLSEAAKTGRVIDMTGRCVA